MTKRKRQLATVSSTERWRKRKRYQEACSEMEEGRGTVREQQRGTERAEMNRKKGRDSGIQNEKTP